jgi:4-hydroxybenzoate polyprenyltransferase
MKQILANLLMFGFLLLPAIVLGLRAARPNRMPWWAAFTLTAVMGWGFVLGAALLMETPDDGAKKVFALFFGWLYGLLWFLPWLAAYAAIQAIRRRLADHK